MFAIYDDYLSIWLGVLLRFMSAIGIPKVLKNIMAFNRESFSSPRFSVPML